MSKAVIKRRYLIVPGAIIAIAAGGTGSAAAAGDEDEATAGSTDRATRSALVVPHASAEQARPGATRPGTHETGR
jgi:hypothetical protein